MWRSAAAWLLGFFIVGEALFLLLSPALKMFPVRSPPEQGELTFHVQQQGTVTDIELLQQTLDGAAWVVQFWAQLTAHSQDWALFTAPPPEYVGFPTVELHFADGTTAEIRSAFEPRDPDHFVRWPGTATRQFNYEHALMIFVQRGYPTGQWLQWWRFAAERQQKSRAAYLQWRITQYHQEHPQTPPLTAAVLKARLIAVLPTGHAPRERGPTWEVPLIRWRSGEVWEVFNPERRAFGPLAGGENRLGR